MQQQSIPEAFTAISADISQLARNFAETPQTQALATVEASLGLYQQQAQTHVSEVSEAVNTAILAAYGEARAACQKNDGDGFRVQRQHILKGFLHASYIAQKRALDSSKLQEAVPWVQYIGQMARWDSTTHEALRALEGNAQEAKTKVQPAVLGWFASQVRSEVEASIKNMKEGRGSQAFVESVEAILYLTPIETDLGAEIGQEKSNTLRDALYRYKDAASEKSVSLAESIATEVSAILSQ